MTFQNFVTLLSGLGGVLFGGVLFRIRERARLDEEAAAELRKVRVDALLEVLRSVGALYRATLEAIDAEMTYQAEKTDEAGQRALAAAKRRRDLSRATNDVAFGSMLLVPPSLRASLKALQPLFVATTLDEAARAFEAIVVAVEEYLPPLTRYQRFEKKQEAEKVLPPKS